MSDSFDLELIAAVRLRQLQADLAASQADLTRVERERDEARFDRDRAIANRKLAVKDRNLADAELASARQELDRWRKAGRDVIAQSGWIVARDGGRHCERCEAEIRRGEAYQLEPGVDELAHIHCPNINQQKGGTTRG